MSLVELYIYPWQSPPIENIAFGKAYLACSELMYMAM